MELFIVFFQIDDFALLLNHISFVLSAVQNHYLLLEIFNLHILLLEIGLFTPDFLLNFYKTINIEDWTYLPLSSDQIAFFS